MMDKSTAQRLLATLASNGVPPTDLRSATKLIASFSVGVDDWITRLSDTYLKNLCTTDQHFKLVLAPYGGGKTHFLISIAARASSDNFAVAFVSCIPDRPGSSVRIDNPHGLYQEVAARVTLPTSPGIGIQILVEAFVDRKREEIRNAGVPDTDAAFRMVKRSLSSELPSHACGEFAQVLAHAASWVWDPESDNLTGQAAMMWLGGRFSAMTKDHWNAIGLRPPPKAKLDEFGRQSLNGLVRLCVMAGCSGVALLIDEVETLFSVRGKALNKVLGSMRVMVDRSASFDIPMFCVFSATPDVVPQIDSYPALQQRLSVVGASFSEGNDYAPQIDLSKLEIDQLSLLKQIGEKLINIASDSAPDKLDREIQVRNAFSLAEVAAKRNLDVDARRIFVKCWASLLQLQIQTGERVFNNAELASRYASDLDGIRTADRDFEA